MKKDYIITKSRVLKEWKNKQGIDMITYEIRVEGDEDILQINQVKTTPAPHEGQVIYGEVSVDDYGKKLHKKSKDFDAEPVLTSIAMPSQDAPARTNNNDSFYRCNALNNAVAVGGDLKTILGNAEEFIMWLDNSAVKPVSEEPLPEPQGEVMDIEGEINLDDIPF